MAISYKIDIKNWNIWRFFRFFFLGVDTNFHRKYQFKTFFGNFCQKLLPEQLILLQKWFLLNFAPKSDFGQNCLKKWEKYVSCDSLSSHHYSLIIDELLIVLLFNNYLLLTITYWICRLIDIVLKRYNIFLKNSLRPMRIVPMQQPSPDLQPPLGSLRLHHQGHRGRPLREVWQGQSLLWRSCQGFLLLWVHFELDWRCYRFYWV